MVFGKKSWTSKLHERHKKLLWRVAVGAIPLRGILLARFGLVDKSYVLCRLRGWKGTPYF